MFKGPKELKQRSLGVFRSTFAVLLKDWLPRIGTLFKINDGSDRILWAAIEGDHLTAARVEWNTKEQV